jgi:probable HAF family extracellular repeat protein
MYRASTQIFRYAGTVAVVFAVVTTTPILAAPGDIYNLGSLGESSYGYAINNAGQVSGHSYNTSTAVRAFLYTGTPGAGGLMADLGTLGGTSSGGVGINALGQTVGGSFTAGNTSSHAFVYTGTPGAGGVMKSLGTLGGNSSGATAINDNGHVTGSSVTTSPSGEVTDHAFLYTGTPGAGGTMVDIHTFGPGQSFGTAINNVGQVAGFFYPPAGGTITEGAFLYSGTPGAGGAMVDLGTLGGRRTHAYAINNSGQVAGFSELSIGSGSAHAYRYTGTPGAGGTMVDLGRLGGHSSTGHGINDAGFVVGSSNLPDGGVTAVLWQTDPANTIINLDAWLDATNPTLGAHWTLIQARDINDHGLVTAYGYFDDGPGGLTDGDRAFILDASSLVPEPSGLALIGTVGGCMVRRRPRRLRRR